jgi:hypothetical protein
MASPPSGWQPVHAPPQAITFGLVPLEDHDGSARRVMLLVWMLSEDGAALVQPIIRGEDDPLPWGMATRAHDPPPGGRPEDGIAGYADHVVPMVMAVEAMLERGLPPAGIAGRFREAQGIARVAGGGRRDVGRMARGDAPGGG